MKNEKHIRKLSRASKHSYYVIIPKEIVEKYKWKERQFMSIEDKGGGEVVIRDRKGKR